jgi:hypothetical protein
MSNIIKRIKLKATLFKQWLDFSECSREQAGWECKRKCKGQEDH